MGLQLLIKLNINPFELLPLGRYLLVYKLSPLKRSMDNPNVLHTAELTQSAKKGNARDGLLSHNDTLKRRKHGLYQISRRCAGGRGCGGLHAETWSWPSLT